MNYFSFQGLLNGFAVFEVLMKGVGSLFNQSMKIQIIYVSNIIQHVPFEMMMLCCFMSLSYTYKGIRHMQEVSYYQLYFQVLIYESMNSEVHSCC